MELVGDSLLNIYNLVGKYCTMFLSSHGEWFYLLWGISEFVVSIIGLIIGAISFFSLFILPKTLRKYGRWVVVGITVIYTLTLIYSIWVGAIGHGFGRIVKAIFITVLPVSLGIASISGAFIYSLEDKELKK